MEADLTILHRGDFYRVLNFKCQCTECSLSAKEYNHAFDICFVRSGYFEYNVFRNNYEAHIGRLLVTKPGAEHTTRHIDNQPDICTVLDFTPAFYERLKDEYATRTGWFFRNEDISSVLLKTSGEIEYLHHQLLHDLQHYPAANLLIDDHVVELLTCVMQQLAHAEELPSLPASLKKYHLITIENAIGYLHQNFDTDIRLEDLATYCCVSVFHFSRIFKSVMNVSPYRYLTTLRLNHARALLQTSNLAVSQIALNCGFNSVEQFAVMFRQHFSQRPSDLRKAIA